MHARTDKLSEIASVKLGFRDNNFLAEIRIPLLNKFATEVYRMHPVPIPQQHQDHLYPPTYNLRHNIYLLATINDVIASSHKTT